MRRPRPHIWIAVESDLRSGRQSTTHDTSGTSKPFANASTLISTRSAAGIANLAPYSFFNVASVNPPVLCVTQVNPPNASEARPHKDTLSNLLETRECVVQIAASSQLQVLNTSAGLYPPDVDEFELAGLQPVPSQLVDVPAVADAPVRYECRLREVLPISTLPMGGTMMLLDVIGIEVHDSVASEQGIDPKKHDALGKLGGDGYSTTREQQYLSRPVVKA